LPIDSEVARKGNCNAKAKSIDKRKLSYMQTLRILRHEQLEQAWGVYHALIARADFRKEKEAVPA
jgi:hypothetical protein